MSDADNEHRMNRSFLEAGGLESIIIRDAPCQRVLTAEEREASLRAALAERPPGDVWLFAYGSLIWNPTVHTVERRIARIEGWHRAFCLASKAGRGTIDKPGLVLGLDEGGCCDGVALRLAEADMENELALLWRREMVTGAYVPRWLDLHGQDGACFGKALAFTMDKAHVNYAGDLVIDAVVKVLATAVGSLGTSAEYLFRTRDGLRACGIPDAELERLAESVEAELALNAAASGL